MKLIRISKQLIYSRQSLYIYTCIKIHFITGGKILFNWKENFLQKCIKYVHNNKTFYSKVKICESKSLKSNSKQDN